MLTSLGSVRSGGKSLERKFSEGRGLRFSVQAFRYWIRLSYIARHLLSFLFFCFCACLFFITTTHTRLSSRRLYDCTSAPSLEPRSLTLFFLHTLPPLSFTSFFRTLLLPLPHLWTTLRPPLLHHIRLIRLTLT